jgi:23S rRNA (guanosine2251-2'-O)-methyltransferase
MKKNIIFGLHSCLSVIENRPEDIINIYLGNYVEKDKIKKITKELTLLGINYKEVSKKMLDDLSSDGNHQGIVIENKSKKLKLLEDYYSNFKSPKQSFLMLILDQITDPHNLGACLRSALAFGVDCVLITQNKSAGISDTVSKVSCGADQILDIYTCVNLASAIEKLKSYGIWFYGADQEASNSIFEIKPDHPMAVVMGSEGKGIRRLTRDKMDFMVKIPISKKIESLNVSVASGVVLSHIMANRGQ